MVFHPTITQEQRDEVKRRLVAGETASSISGDVGIGVTSVNRIRAQLKKTDNKELGGIYDFSEVKCDNREQSYRENLKWAIDAAGIFLRTKKHPEVCPCNAALYLYRQAVSEPKDFISKIGQIENKREDDHKDDLRRATKRTVKEIDDMLRELDGKIS